MNPRGHAGGNSQQGVLEQIHPVEAEDVPDAQPLPVHVPQAQAEDAGIHRREEVLLVDEEPGQGGSEQYVQGYQGQGLAAVGYPLLQGRRDSKRYIPMASPRDMTMP
jgi:hypothetical protein